MTHDFSFVCVYVWRCVTSINRLITKLTTQILLQTIKCLTKTCWLANLYIDGKKNNVQI